MGGHVSRRGTLGTVATGGTAATERLRVVPRAAGHLGQRRRINDSIHLFIVAPHDIACSLHNPFVYRQLLASHVGQFNQIPIGITNIHAPQLTSGACPIHHLAIFKDFDAIRFEPVKHVVHMVLDQEA